MIYLVLRDYKEELNFENFSTCYDSLSAVPLLQKMQEKHILGFIVNCDIQTMRNQLI